MGIPGSANLFFTSDEEGGYKIEKSCRFDSSDAAGLTRSFGSGGNRKTWTLSFWTKRCYDSSFYQSYFINRDSAGYNLRINDPNTCQFHLAFRSGVALSFPNYYKDFAAWMHCCIVYDSTNATANDRCRLYVNGERVLMPSGSQPSLNQDSEFNGSSVNHGIGYFNTNTALDAYLADYHFIDGQGLTASDFGETNEDTGEWDPIAYTGSYGTTGFYLKFNGSNLGTDSSGNGNHWTTSNLSTAAGKDNDALTDTPTNYGTENGLGGEVRGNYCTLNPLDRSTNGYITLWNGNLNTTGGSGDYAQVRATMAMTSGKWYWEVTRVSGNGTADPRAGVCSSETPLTATRGGSHSKSWAYLIASGTNLGGKGYHNGSYSGSSNPFSNNGDVGMFAYDADAGKLWFGKNGTWAGSGNPAAGTNEFYSGVTAPVFPFVDSYHGVTASNFGQRAWEHSAPTGFQGLNSSNLPEPAVVNPRNEFDTVLWEGNNSTQTISGLNFSPGLLWYKSRNNAHYHGIQDTLRGVGKSITSSGTQAEYDETSGLTGFTSDGFTLNGGGYYNINFFNSNQVGWVWNGGSSNTSVSVGGLNSSSYNQSEVWSNSVTGTAYSGTYPITNAFNGDLSNRSLASSSAGHTFTPSSAITVNSSLRVWFGYADSSATNVFKVNGTDYSSLITATGYNIGWITVPGISSITSIFYGVTPSGSEDSSISAIEVDGKILVDSNISAPNVPTIASTHRANPTAGFSMVKYVGTGSLGTVAHGLNSSPSLLLIKGLDDQLSWGVYIDVPSNYLQLSDYGGNNGTDASNSWNGTAPTSSVFTVKSKHTVNQLNENYICYAWSSVPGYSHIGTYKGNGLTGFAGKFVWTGFRPAFILLKRRDASTWHWWIRDVVRDPNNPADQRITASSTSTESASDAYDIHSNGFKLTLSNGDYNGSNQYYVYAAFAEAPANFARAR